MLTVEITEKEHRLNFRLKQVKVGQPSDTFIKLVPFIWGSISEGAIKKGVRTITTGWGKFQKKGIVC